MEQIRVNRGIEIGVNDNGDSIFIDAENMEWVRKYDELIENTTAIADRLDAVDSKNMTDVEQLDVVIEAMREIMAEIDKMFGENTCKKVFGDIVPMPTAVVEFFDLLSPIIEKYATAKRERIEKKYSTNRRGSKK